MNKDRISWMIFPLAAELAVGKLSVVQVFQAAKQSGLCQIDLMNIPSKKLSVYQAASKASGVDVCCYIEWLSFFVPRQALENAIRQAAEKAKQLQAKHLMIVPYKGLSDQLRARSMGRKAVLQAMCRGFQLAVELCRREGVSVCFENTPHTELCLSASADCKAVLDAVPGLGFVFDTANMLPAGEDTLTAYTMLKPYINYVHLKDVTLSRGRAFSRYAEHTADGRAIRFAVWGDGIIPLEALVQNMLADGYTGDFALEYARPGAPLCGMAQHMEQLARHLDQPWVKTK